MLSSLTLLVATAMFILHPMNAQIPPTIFNSTGEYYITSQSDYNLNQYFQDGIITCNESVSHCHIICDTSRGCQYLRVYAPSTSTTLIIQCTQFLSCYAAEIYANSANSVLLSCGVEGVRLSCKNLQLHAGNVANTVTILCDSDSACYGADFNASNANDFAIVCLYSRSGSDFSYRPCDDATIYCPRRSCNITMYIGGMDSLTVYIATKVNNKVHLNCTIEYDSYYCRNVAFVCEDTGVKSLIQYDPDRPPYIDRPTCSDFMCCPFLTGYIPCLEGVPCQIDCDEQDCNFCHINATLATSLTLNCGANGCHDSFIQCPSTAASSCDIQCTTPYACQYTSIETMANTMHQFVINCTALESCRSMQVQLHSAVIDKLVINCNEIHACYRAFFSAQVALDSSVDLRCVHPPNGLIPRSDYAACYMTTFDLRGDSVIGSATNNVSCVCGIYDCVSVNLTLSNPHHLVQIDCFAENSCYYLRLNMGKVEHTVVQCSGDLSCAGLKIEQESGDTLVQCSAKEACKDARFNHYSYKHVQLDIQCSAYMSCTSATIDCHSDSGTICIDPPPFYTYTMGRSASGDYFVFDCDDFTNGCAYIPTPKPTHDPSYPTKSPTHKPSKDPSPNPTHNATNSPTKQSTTDPTIEPTVDPTHKPNTESTVDPTITTSIEPTVHTSTTLDTLDLTLLICGSILLIVCIIVVIVLVSKSNKQGQPQLTSRLLSHSLHSLSELGAPNAIVPDVSATLSEMEDDTEAIPIQHAMVILIAIGEYDDIQDDADDELAALGGLNNLDGIEKDIQNLHRLFGPMYLNYTIYPEYNMKETLKVHWTQDDIIDFLHEKATYLESHLDEFDGLIVVISGHGMKGFICTSDCKMIEKLAIHRLFSLLHLRLRQIPRVFLFDCCDGEWECKDRNKGPSDQRKLYTCKDIGSTDIAWGKDEKNPDHRLAQIDAANPGFQSKFNRKKGSYMLFEFVERTISRLDHEQNTCIYRIFDEVQQHLAEKGKQLIKTSYSDRTRWITLLPKQRDTEDEKNDMMDSDDSVLDEILDETIVEMATKDCINNPAFDVQENH